MRRYSLTKTLLKLAILSLNISNKELIVSQLKQYVKKTRAISLNKDLNKYKYLYVPTNITRE